MLQFKYLHDPDEIWSLQKLKGATFLQIPCDETIAAQNVDLSILNHRLQTTSEDLFEDRPIGRSETDMRADSFVQKMWAGLLTLGVLCALY